MPPRPHPPTRTPPITLLWQEAGWFFGRNAAGQQPLHCLSHSGGGALEAVRALIGAGAPLRGAAAADVDAETPAHVAARAGHALVLRALLVSQHRCTRPV